MSQYNQDMQNWNKTNIFLDSAFFLAFQMSLQPIQIIHGSYETYQTEIVPVDLEEWSHVVVMPGTAFKFHNKVNAETMVRSLLAVMNIKNLHIKFHILGHRTNPIFPQVLTDTLQIVKILIQQQNIKKATLITWSSGSCMLRQVTTLLQQNKCEIKRLIMISPVYDLSNKQRAKVNDFLNADFFYFVEKIYCQQDIGRVRSLSLICNLREIRELDVLVKYPMTIVYGEKEFVRKDVEEYICLMNQCKKKLNFEQVQTNCYLNENHALYCFITTKQTLQNKEAMSNIAKVKWQVSKYIADIIQKDIVSDQKRELFNIQSINKTITNQENTDQEKKTNLFQQLTPIQQLDQIGME